MPAVERETGAQRKRLDHGLGGGVNPGAGRIIGGRLVRGRWYKGRGLRVDAGPPFVPARRALEGVADAEHRFLVERAADHLQGQRKAVGGETATQA